MDWKGIRELIVPRIASGMWSLRFMAAFLLLLATMQLLVLSGQRGGRTLTDNFVPAIPGVTMAISRVLAFVTGIVAILRSKERSVLVLASTTIGFLILWFLVG